MYACGCVWWHLLCGRPPLAGGNSLAKLRAAQAGEICDVRRHALNVPAPLAVAISSCLERERGTRAESPAQIAALLGPPTRDGRQALAACLAQAGRPTIRWTTTAGAIRGSTRTPLWTAAAVCCLAAVVALWWPMWQRGDASGATAGLPSSVGSTIGQANRGTLTARLPGSITLPPHPSSHPQGEGMVEPVAYHEVARPEDLTLSGDAPTVTTKLEVQAGQCVRGPTGHRAVVLVPREGWTIDKENVHFENLDFAWRPTGESNQPNPTRPAFVRLLAGHAEFDGCTFQCEPDRIDPPSAICWTHPSQADRSETSLPNGRLRMVNCVMRHVAVGVDCSTIGALSLDLTNVLLVDAGPTVRLDHCPRPDEPTALSLRQVTLRDSGPLLECRIPQPQREPGEITIHSTACAFAPSAGVPLVRLVAAETPARVPAAVRWTGQGTLVTPQTAILVWRGLAGEEHAADEATLAIAGLVRSRVQFAGDASDDPAASHLTRWQAPLQSADAPGIDPRSLPASRVIAIPGEASNRR